MIAFLAILWASYSASATACATNTENSACANAGCFWNAGVGICKAAECSLDPECGSHCDYIAPVPAQCVDGVGASCAAIGTDQTACSANNNCRLTDEVCIVSAEAKAKCDVAIFDSCPGGCERKSTTVCEPPYTRDNCLHLDAALTVTQCTYRKNGACKWETTGGGRCVGVSASSDEYCGQFNNTEISECFLSKTCKVSNGSCVFDSNNEYYKLCNGISVTEETTQCESKSDCQIKDGQCVNAEGVGWDPQCERYSAEPILACSLEASTYCLIKNGSCEPGLDEYCGSTNSCSSPCTTRNNDCIYADCSSLSTEVYTECEMFPRVCKVVTSGGVKQCQLKTASEHCPSLSTVKYSNCEVNFNCRIADGQCVTREGRNVDYCGSYDVEKTESECRGDGYINCKISETTGTCVPVGHCNLNGEGTDCDENNSPADRCRVESKYTCVNADCSTESDADSCNDKTIDYGISAGCEWGRTCVTKNPLTCSITESNTCSLEGCTLIPGISETCTRKATITDSTCGVIGENTACDLEIGCTWSTTGGTCVEKNCNNNPSYDLCCNDNTSCAYCATNGDASATPSDCPDPDLNPDCTADPNATGCKSSAFRVMVPAFFLILAFIVLDK